MGMNPRWVLEEEVPVPSRLSIESEEERAWSAISPRGDLGRLNGFLKPLKDTGQINPHLGHFE